MTGDQGGKQLHVFLRSIWSKGFEFKGLTSLWLAENRLTAFYVSKINSGAEGLNIIQQDMIDEWQTAADISSAQQMTFESVTVIQDQKEKPSRLFE